MELEQLIKSELEKLPFGCTRDYPLHVQNGHEWSITYSKYKDVDTLLKSPIGKSYILPHYLCKHCHAVGKVDPNTPYDEIIRRVR